MGKNATTWFGPTLKRFREEAGLTQKELADKAGMNVYGVAKIEQREREPYWSTVLDLAEALGIPVARFAEENGKIPANEATKKKPGRKPKR